MRASSVILAIAVLGAAAGTASAQGRGRNKNNDNVPPGHRPPAGMCRIWIDGVPPGHQPAPTDCEMAVRNQPPNSRIIWGDNTSRRDRNVYDDRNDRSDRRESRRDYARDANGNPYDPTCVDNNRDGWCDYHPEIRSGVRTRDVARFVPAAVFVIDVDAKPSSHARDDEIGVDLHDHLAVWRELAGTPRQGDDGRHEPGSGPTLEHRFSRYRIPEGSRRF